MMHASTHICNPGPGLGCWPHPACCLGAWDHGMQHALDMLPELLPAREAVLESCDVLIQLPLVCC